jgi:4-amino-4-deoxy-L-arabinose transferase-like glycosyltransferase/tetratricopeptide (TPR) repeat protein
MRRDLVVLVVILVFGASLRLIGLTRGASDFVPSGQSRSEVFYTFHPDEETLLRAALQLDSLSAPPLTAYGTFPMLVARAVLEVSGLFYADELTLENTAARPVVFVTGRLLSIAFSLGLLALVFWVGRAYFGLWSGALAAFWLASAPLAIQQGHFYTVDGVFAFLVFAALACALRALRTDDMRAFVGVGLLIGLAAATRLNGALFGVALVAVYLGKDGPINLQSMLARIRRPAPWATALVALAVLFVLEPYLVVDSALMRRALDSGDFAYSLQIASGEVLRPWTLVDMHTTPYLHFWTHLWPQAVGWPLTGLFVLGVLYALWRRRWPTSLLLVWCVLYFLSIGGLHTKHVRYLLPILPALALLAAVLCVESWRWLQSAEEKSLSMLRWPAALVVGGVLFYTAAYGTAFARIYAVEDARLQAARWLYANVPAGSTIAVENGGFSLGEFVDRGTYKKAHINSGRLFGTRGYLLCEAGRQYLYSRVRDADYIAVADVNRHVQYTAVPEMYPVLASFYARLLAGELGFKSVQHFKTYAEWGRWRFADERAEPSFYSFDHPGVHILQRTAEFTSQWLRWEAELAANAHCADASLKDFVSSAKKSVGTESVAAIASLRRRYPDFRLLALIEADMRRQLGDEEGLTQGLSDYSQGYLDPALSAQFVPWAAATSLLMLEMPELALAALTDGVEKKDYMRPDQRVQLADSYASIAHRLARGGQGGLATDIYRLAAVVDARAEFCNSLAALAMQDGRDQEALSWWQTSLALDATQMPIYRLAGKVAYRLKDYGPAFEYLGKAVELDPLLEAQQKVADFNALAQEAQRVGLSEWAVWLWQRSLALDGQQVGVKVLLQAARGE